MKQLLVPIDFSEVSRDQVRYALHLAAEREASVLVLHAYLPAMPEPYLLAAMQDQLAEEQERLAVRFFEELRQEMPDALLENVSLDFRLEIGAPIETILQVNEQVQPDLLLMGMRRGSAWAKKLFGSTTTGVIQRVDTPVLVLPQGYGFRPPSQVTYASDLEQEDVETLAKLADWVAPWQASLDCVHVREGRYLQESLNQQRLQEQCHRASDCLKGLEIRSLTEQDIEDGLLHYVDREGVDLLALRTHQRGFWAGLMHHSVSRELARKSPIPVLVFPAERQKSALSEE